MATIVNDRPLTRDERDLLVAVRRHLRADGWTLYGGARHVGAHLDADWAYGWNVDGKHGRVLEIRLLTKWGSTQRVALSADVGSVQEAVDVVVAFGLLPQGMSSAYQAGRESAPQWTEPLLMHAEDIKPGYMLVSGYPLVSKSGVVAAASPCDRDPRDCPWSGNCVALAVDEARPAHFRAIDRFYVRIPVAAS